jgi:hypothetical protein
MKYVLTVVSAFIHSICGGRGPLLPLQHGIKDILIGLEPVQAVLHGHLDHAVVKFLDRLYGLARRLAACLLLKYLISSTGTCLSPFVATGPRGR